MKGQINSFQLPNKKALRNLNLPVLPSNSHSSTTFLGGQLFVPFLLPLFSLLIPLTKKLFPHFFFFFLHIYSYIAILFLSNNQASVIGGGRSRDINMSNNSNQTSYDISDDSRGVKNQDSVKEEFSEAEESLIAKMFKLVGERWPLIAGRIPGRTAEEIEKYWKSRSSSASE